MIELPTWRARHIWYRDWCVFKKFAFTNILPYFAEPLLFILALGYGLGIFVGQIGGVSYAQFLAPGILSSSAMFAASYENTYSTYVRMIFQKTFEAVLCTPLSIEDIVTGEVAWGATKSIISGICIFIVVWALGLIKLESAMIIIPVVALTGLMFAALSMFFTSIVPFIRRVQLLFHAARVSHVPGIRRVLPHRPASVRRQGPGMVPSADACGRISYGLRPWGNTRYRSFTKQCGWSHLHLFSFWPRPF